MAQVTTEWLTETLARAGALDAGRIDAVEINGVALEVVRYRADRGVALIQFGGHLR